MKSFLKKRWHHLPVGIITAVLVACLIAGGAFAAYGFFTTAAQVTVEEALGVVFTPNDASASWDGETITFSNIEVGENAGWMLWITNSASVDIPVTITWTQTGGPDPVQNATGTETYTESYSFMGVAPPGQAGNVNPASCVVPAGAVAGWEYQGTGTPQCAVGLGFHAGYSSTPGTYTFTLDIVR